MLVQYSLFVCQFLGPLAQVWCMHPGEDITQLTDCISTLGKQEPNSKLIEASVSAPIDSLGTDLKYISDDSSPPDPASAKDEAEKPEPGRTPDDHIIHPKKEPKLKSPAEINLVGSSKENGESSQERFASEPDNKSSSNKIGDSSLYPHLKTHREYKKGSPAGLPPRATSTRPASTFKSQIHQTNDRFPRKPNVDFQNNRFRSFPPPHDPGLPPSFSHLPEPYAERYIQPGVVYIWRPRDGPQPPNEPSYDLIAKPSHRILWRKMPQTSHLQTGARPAQNTLKYVPITPVSQPAMNLFPKNTFGYVSETSPGVLGKTWETGSHQPHYQQGVLNQLPPMLRGLLSRPLRISEPQTSITTQSRVPGNSKHDSIKGKFSIADQRAESSYSKQIASDPIEVSSDGSRVEILPKLPAKSQLQGFPVLGEQGSSQKLKSVSSFQEMKSNQFQRPDKLVDHRIQSESTNLNGHLKPTNGDNINSETITEQPQRNAKNVDTGSKQNPDAAQTALDTDQASKKHINSGGVASVEKKESRDRSETISSAQRELTSQKNKHQSRKPQRTDQVQPLKLVSIERTKASNNRDSEATSRVTSLAVDPIKSESYRLEAVKEQLENSIEHIVKEISAPSIQGPRKPEVNSQSEALEAKLKGEISPSKLTVSEMTPASPMATKADTNPTKNPKKEKDKFKSLPKGDSTDPQMTLTGAEASQPKALPGNKLSDTAKAVDKSTKPKNSKGKKGASSNAGSRVSWESLAKLPIAEAKPDVDLNQQSSFHISPTQTALIAPFMEKMRDYNNPDPSPVDLLSGVSSKEGIEPKNESVKPKMIVKKKKSSPKIQSLAKSRESPGSGYTLRSNTANPEAQTVESVKSGIITQKQKLDPKIESSAKSSETSEPVYTLKSSTPNPEIQTIESTKPERIIQKQDLGTDIESSAKSKDSSEAGYPPKSITPNPDAQSSTEKKLKFEITFAEAFGSDFDENSSGSKPSPTISKIISGLLSKSTERIDHIISHDSQNPQMISILFLAKAMRYNDLSLPGVLNETFYKMLTWFGTNHPNNYRYTELELIKRIGYAEGTRRANILRKQLFHHTITLRWEKLKELWIDRKVLTTLEAALMDERFGITKGAHTLIYREKPQSIDCSRHLRVLLCQIFGATETQRRLDLINYVAIRKNAFSWLPSWVIGPLSLRNGLDPLKFLKVGDALQFGLRGNFMSTGMGREPFDSAFITLLEIMTDTRASLPWVESLERQRLVQVAPASHYQNRLLVLRKCVNKQASEIEEKIRRDISRRQLYESIIEQSMDKPKSWKLGDVLLWCDQGLRSSTMIQVIESLEKRGIKAFQPGRGPPLGPQMSDEVWKNLFPKLKKTERSAIAKFFVDKKNSPIAHNNELAASIAFHLSRPFTLKTLRNWWPFRRSKLQKTDIAYP